MKIIKPLPQLSFLLFFLFSLTSCYQKEKKKINHPQSFKKTLLKSKREAQKKEEKEIQYLLRSYYPESYYENYEFDLSLQRILNRLEKKLVHEEEKNQYYNLKPFMKNNRKRIEFLLNLIAKGKKIWTQKKNLKRLKKKRSAFIKSLIQKRDVTLGMTQDEVKMSLGLPNSVSIAGNPLYRNEKWEYIYSYLLETSQIDSTTTIYFEGGVVSGWDRY